MTVHKTEEEEMIYA